MIDITRVFEVRSSWERVAASPWAGCRLVNRVRTSDGAVHEIPGQELAAVMAGLGAAGARLVESVEGLGRVARVVWPRRVTSDEASPAAQVRPRPGSVEEALVEMVEVGTGNRPGLRKRLGLAADLVREGLVDLVDKVDGVDGVDGGDTVDGRIGPYRITGEACTCADFTHRGGWCKHRLAVRMARHLARYGFELPRRVETQPAGQVRREDLALIASGRVIDEARRRERAYQESGHGARDRAMRMLGNGAGSLPADLARRAGMGRSDE